eukprot:CAMPEP_0175079258 /NCGR_PEP_ID=MMETSP0052_2-20121109/24715_1 /TAXON_ID=51329 ORGANISM="Polytomella parva, Strain SAG 63-3" /NCGR_SAMPLE_ID=MMETSP0052_2 /ASSEMBLY_ACC=CAM_ASM_000194 /LENGTH=898 /DNA_ID=CAMNT_0016349553 /DNA_START=66 /DNA_END=2759 /DNA_ORIENTATION=-
MTHPSVMNASVASQSLRLDPEAAVLLDVLLSRSALPYRGSSYGNRAYSASSPSLPSPAPYCRPEDSVYHPSPPLPIGSPPFPLPSPPYTSDVTAYILQDTLTRLSLRNPYSSGTTTYPPDPSGPPNHDQPSPLSSYPQSHLNPPSPSPLQNPPSNLVNPLTVSEVVMAAVATVAAQLLSASDRIYLGLRAAMGSFALSTTGHNNVLGDDTRSRVNAAGNSNSGSGSGNNNGSGSGNKNGGGSKKGNPESDNMGRPSSSYSTTSLLPYITTTEQEQGLACLVRQLTAVLDQIGEGRKVDDSSNKTEMVSNSAVEGNSNEVKRSMKEERESQMSFALAEVMMERMRIMNYDGNINKNSICGEEDGDNGSSKRSDVDAARTRCNNNNTNSNNAKDNPAPPSNATSRLALYDKQLTQLAAVLAVLNSTTTKVANRSFATVAAIMASVRQSVSFNTCTTVATSSYAPNSSTAPSHPSFPSPNPPNASDPMSDVLQLGIDVRQIILETRAAEQATAAVGKPLLAGILHAVSCLSVTLTQAITVFDASPNRSWRSRIPDRRNSAFVRISNNSTRSGVFGEVSTSSHISHNVSCDLYSRNDHWQTLADRWAVSMIANLKSRIQIANSARRQAQIEYDAMVQHLQKPSATMMTAQKSATLTAAPPPTLTAAAQGVASLRELRHRAQARLVMAQRQLIGLIQQLRFLSVFMAFVKTPCFFPLFLSSVGYGVRGESMCASPSADHHLYLDNEIHSNSTLISSDGTSTTRPNSMSKTTIAATTTVTTSPTTPSSTSSAPDAAPSSNATTSSARNSRDSPNLRLFASDCTTSPYDSFLCLAVPPLPPALPISSWVIFDAAAESSGSGQSMAPSSPALYNPIPMLPWEREGMAEALGVGTGIKSGTGSGVGL